MQSGVFNSVFSILSHFRTNVMSLRVSSTVSERSKLSGDLILTLASGLRLDGAKVMRQISAREV